MQRIGLAASKMAHGNLVKYNLFVVGISFLFSIFIFLMSGLSVLVTLFLISLVLRAFMPPDFVHHWPHVVKTSILALAIIMGVLNIIAIVKNLKFSRTNL